jgi:hypothetical protein
MTAEAKNAALASAGIVVGSLGRAFLAMAF